MLVSTVTSGDLIVLGNNFYKQIFDLPLKVTPCPLANIPPQKAHVFRGGNLLCKIRHKYFQRRFFPCEPINRR